MLPHLVELCQRLIGVEGCQNFEIGENELDELRHEIEPLLKIKLLQTQSSQSSLATDNVQNTKLLQYVEQM